MRSSRPIRPMARVLALAVIAGLVYGAWAFFANRGHGLPIAARSGAVQGASSAATTLVISGGIEALFGALPRRWWRAAVAWLVPPTCSSGVHVIAHLLVGTPEVLRTVLPSVAIGYVFAAAYVRTLASPAAPVAREAA